MTAAVRTRSVPRRARTRRTRHARLDWFVRAAGDGDDGALTVHVPTRPCRCEEPP